MPNLPYPALATPTPVDILQLRARQVVDDDPEGFVHIINVLGTLPYHCLSEASPILVDNDMSGGGIQTPAQTSCKDLHALMIENSVRSVFI